MFLRSPRAFVWPTAGLLLAAAVAAVAIALLAGNAGAVQAQQGCDLVLDQDDDYTPGSTFDLTFKFTPEDCKPGEFTSEFTIFLHEDITIPSGFDKQDVIIIAGGRFSPDWVDPNRGSGEPHEIELPGCQSWRRGSGDPGVCDNTSPPVVIELNNLQLPDQPDNDDDPYIATIQWDGGSPLTERVRVDATVDIDGDDEAGYGETIKLRGAGFEENVTVEIYAMPNTGSVSCREANAGGWSGWTQVGTAEVGSNYRFTAEIDISSTQFRSAVRHQICAVDGAGNTNGTSISLVITAGLELIGSSEVSPGDRVTFKLVGGGALASNPVRVQGRQHDQWSRSGDNLIVTLPPSASGRVTVGVTLASGKFVSTIITIRDADLSVRPDSGLGLGEQFLVSSNNLAGNQVCQVSLDGVPLAFLDEGQDSVEDCRDVARGGRFVAPVAMIGKNGRINSDLITKLLESDGEEELEITSEAGVKASATVKIAKPTLTVSPDEGEVSPGDTLVFRGTNFPVERGYYNPPNIIVEINGRIAHNVYTSSGTREFEYRVPSRAEGGERLRPVVKIDDYQLHDLTLDLDLVVTPGRLEIDRDEVRIGEPIRVTVSGLDRFTQGYSVGISRGPTLSFDGETRFASDGSGTFSRTTVIPEDYHRDYAEERTHPATFHVYKSGSRLPGVTATVTLLPRRFVPPTFAPDPPAAPAVVADGPFGLTVAWEEPAYDGGSRVTHYDVEYLVSGDGNYTGAGTGEGTSHTITGLAQGTEYQVRVRAINDVGPSLWSGPATGATEQLVARIEPAPDTLSIVAGEPAGFRITLSHTATVTVKLTHETDGGFGTEGSGECVITSGTECAYSVDTSGSQDSDSGSLTVNISPDRGYTVGTSPARVSIQNPEPTPTPVPPTPTPTPEPTAPPEPTATPIPPPPTVDQAALTATIVAAVTTGESETRDRPVAEEETSDGGLSGLAIALIAIVVVAILALAGAMAALALRRRGGGGGGGGDPAPEA